MAATHEKKPLRGSTRALSIRTLAQLIVKGTPHGNYDFLAHPNTGEWDRTFAIITVPSNELVGQIHDRMPAILKPRSYERWLGLDPDPHDLLITYPSQPMTMWPISTRVNRPDNDDPSLLDRTGDPFDLWAPLRSEGRA